MRYNALSAKSKAAAQETAGIDQNHTHFLMVDDGNDKFGGELSLRTALEEHIKEVLKARRPPFGASRSCSWGQQPPSVFLTRISDPELTRSSHS